MSLGWGVGATIKNGARESRPVVNERSDASKIGWHFVLDQGTDCRRLDR